MTQSRNEGEARQGIDTSHTLLDTCGVCCRNEVKARQGIDTSYKQDFPIIDHLRRNEGEARHQGIDTSEGNNTWKFLDQ